MTITVVNLNALTASDNPVVDRIGGEDFQFTKLTDGTTDSTTAIHAAAGVAANALRVVQASDSTVLVVGADAENAAASGAPVQVGGRYDASPRTLGDGDVGAVALDVNGNVGIQGIVDLGATDNAVLDAILVEVTATAAAVGGAHIDDAAFTVGTSDGVPIFGMFDDASPDSVDEGDAGVVRMTAQRSLHVTQQDAAQWDVSADYAAAQTNATVKAAPGASLSLYITDVIISNGATAGNITLLDGSGGTVLLELYPAINGGLAHSFRNPLKLTANTLLAITSTTVTTHSVTVSGYIAA